MRTWLAVLGLVAGCTRAAPTIDEGCIDELGGASLLGDVSPAWLERANCYRGYLGVPPLKVVGGVQEAAEAHMAYLVRNDVFDPESPGFARDRGALVEEIDGLPEFSGANPFWRNVETGVTAREGLGTVSEGSVWGWFFHDAGADFDTLFHSPWVREVFLQPLVVGVGLAEGKVGGQARRYVDVVSKLPSGRRVTRPIVYPKDGQTGVPVGFLDPAAYPGEPLPFDRAIGYPITVTVSSDVAGIIAYDPYGIDVVAASLAEVDGDAVPILVELPKTNQRLPLRTTVVVAAEEPLAPDTTYAFEIEISTSVRTLRVATQFTTGSDGAAQPDSDTDTDSGTDTLQPSATDTDTDTDTMGPTDTDTGPTDLQAPTDSDGHTDI